jgi:hypothetical protein
MQIIVKEGAFSYMYDSSVMDTIEGGFQEEYFPEPEEAIEAAITLLWNVYPKRALAEALLEGIPAMDYGRPEFIAKSKEGEGADKE